MRGLRGLMLLGVPLGGGAGPTVEITSAAEATAYEAFAITITFSEAVVGFTAGDVTVGNGTLSNFADSGDSTTFTATVTPTASSSVTVDVAAGVCKNAAGNSNEAATQYVLTYDWSHIYAERLVDYGALEIWPLTDIDDGTAIPAHVEAARNGTLAGWALQNAAGPVTADANKAPYSDGNGDYGNIFSDNLAAAFNGTEGALAIWLKMDTGVWTDGAQRSWLDFRSTADLVILRKGAGNNTPTYFWKTKSISQGITPPSGWALWHFSWSDAADALIAGYNGTQVGSTATGVDAWTTALVQAAAGARSTSPGTDSHKGWLAYPTIFAGVVPTLNDFADMYSDAVNGWEPGVSFRGAWTWYSDPRALYLAAVDKTIIGAVKNKGDIVIMVYDHATATLARRVVLHAALQANDHATPALLRRASDGKILAWYGAHNGATIYQRLSSSADDVSAWAAESSLDASLGLATYSYANPVQLTDETDDPIYLFFRGDPDGKVGWAQYYSVSTDGGATWAAAARWLGSDVERPYIKLAQNGNARIDICMTDGHPNEVATNSIYHGYYQGGNLYKSDGTLVGALASGPYTPSQFTKVYDGATVRAWNHAIVIDGDGYPVIVYATFPETTAHRYRYARWNGSAWADAEICTAGTYLYAAELYYSGGVSLDPNDPDVVYASRDTGDGVHQLYKYTWNGSGFGAGTALTSGSKKCIRPFVVKGAGDKRLCYMTGTYTTFANFDTEIVLRA